MPRRGQSNANINLNEALASSTHEIQPAQAALTAFHKLTMTDACKHWLESECSQHSHAAAVSQTFATEAMLHEISRALLIQGLVLKSRCSDDGAATRLLHPALAGILMCAAAKQYMPKGINADGTQTACGQRVCMTVSSRAPIHPRSHDVCIGKTPKTSLGWTRLLPVNDGVQAWSRLPVHILQQ